MLKTKECCVTCRFWDYELRQLADEALRHINTAKLICQENARLNCFALLNISTKNDYEHPVVNTGESYCTKNPPDFRRGFAVTHESISCGCWEPR